MPAIKGELVHPLSREEWRAWLEANHTRQEGAWLVTYKKATGKPRVEYDEAVEEALCFGWVDSKPQKLDEERSLLWFAPRAKAAQAGPDPTRNGWNGCWPRARWRRRAWLKSKQPKPTARGRCLTKSKR